MANDAWCDPGHQRSGIVTNQDIRVPPPPPTGPVLTVAVCDETACIIRAMKHVQARTGGATQYFAQTRQTSRSAG